ncbi:hypothetical protein LUZ60_014819 [Juncus effusus]|nr:hypothetical protein LUZ60_014819 [Juncus effusus]
MPPGRPPPKHQNQKKRGGGGFPPLGNNNYPMYGSNYPPYSGPGPNFNNKKKRPNPSNHFEEGDEPPIDSLFRILCPVRKIGSVLGRGGDIIKSLRVETNAKILVADPVPGSDDRVVIIYSLVTDRSTDQTPSSDQNSESLKPLCPAQDALLKVNDRIAADELYHGGGEEIEVTARILVPRTQAGCVIGKGGAIIKSMREETGAGIKVLPPDFLPPCAMRSDELVQISGMPALVKKALYEISTKLHVNPRKEQPPLNEIIYTSTHGTFSSPPPPHHPHHPPPHHLPPPFEPQWGPPRPPPSFGYDGGFRDTSAYGYSKKYDEFAVRVLCPAWRIGGIIGKRGSNVRRLEEETGAHLQVEETVDEEERVLAVSSKESLSEPVSQTIKFLVQIQSNTSPSDESVVTKLLVPSQKVGCIIGEGGNIINEMRRRTGAGIRVYTKDIRPNFISSDDELVEIAGNPHTAREALIDVCTRLRTRTLRGDAPPPTGAPYDFPPPDGFAPPAPGPGYPPGPGPSFPPPPSNHGYPPPYAPPPSGPNYPPPAGGYPPDASGYPPPAGGYPPPSGGYPPPYAPPAESGYAPPPSYHGPPPAGTGYAPAPAEAGYPPAGGSYPPPASGGYPAPASGPYPHASGSYAPPAGTGYAQPAGAGYPPAGSEYAPPPAANSAYPQPAGESGYPAPAAGGYAPPPVPASGYAPLPQSAHGYPAPAGSGYPPADSGYATQGTNKSPVPVSNAPPAAGGYHGYPQSTAQVAVHAHEPQGYAAQPAPPGYHSASGSLEMRIPTASVEYVIGSDGSNITEIRKISGAKVTVRDPAPGSSECVVEILGSSEQIQSAQGLVHAYVAQQRPPKVEAPPVQIQYQAGPTWN